MEQSSTAAPLVSWSLHSELCSSMQYPLAIEMLQEGKIDVKPMITHRFGFSGRDEVIAGFECAADAAKTKAIKVMFNLPGKE